MQWRHWTWLVTGDGWLVVIFGPFLFSLRRDGSDVGVGGMGDAIDTVPSPLFSDEHLFFSPFTELPLQLDGRYSRPIPFANLSTCDRMPPEESLHDVC